MGSVASLYQPSLNAEFVRHSSDEFWLLVADQEVWLNNAHGISGYLSVAFVCAGTEGGKVAVGLGKCRTWNWETPRSQSCWKSSTAFTGLVLKFRLGHGAGRRKEKTSRNKLPEDSRLRPFSCKRI